MMIQKKRLLQQRVNVCVKYVCDENNLSKLNLLSSQITQRIKENLN